MSRSRPTILTLLSSILLLSLLVQPASAEPIDDAVPIYVPGGEVPVNYGVTVETDGELVGPVIGPIPDSDVVGAITQGSETESFQTGYCQAQVEKPRAIGSGQAYTRGGGQCYQRVTTLYTRVCLDRKYGTTNLGALCWEASANNTNYLVISVRPRCNLQRTETWRGRVNTTAHYFGGPEYDNNVSAWGSILCT